MHCVTVTKDFAHPIAKFPSYVWGDDFLNHTPLTLDKVRIRLGHQIVSTFANRSTNLSSRNNETVETVVSRPRANFGRDVWSDTFCDYYESIDEVTQNQMVQEVNELKEEVRKELLDEISDPKQRLILIDAIQRLGVAYCFEEDIEATLQDLHKNYEGDCYKGDLHYASLRFRLLRQNGFHVSCDDVFDKFTDEHGSFKECLKPDFRGMINLYEASDLRLRGDDTLDEALDFTKSHLASLASSLNSPLADQITHALNRPLYRCTTRHETKYQISIYEYLVSHHEGLLKLAKLEFNLVQLLHKKELSDIIRWSRKLDFTRKFPFARDRDVEGYCWTLGVCYEPKYSRSRIMLNKMLKIMIILDDIYDAYGSIDELESFTEAILRWDNSCTNQLPDYMKLTYQIMLDTFQDFEQELANEGRSSVVYMLRNELKANVKAFIKEARWCHGKYIPSYEEYMNTALVSSIHRVLLISIYQGMGNIASKDSIKWMLQNSKSLNSSCIIARIMNDMGGRKVEHERGHVASVVDCYMKSFSVSEEEAYDELQQQLEERWKDIKKEMLRPTSVPMPLLSQNLNMSRSMYDLYSHGRDAFTSSEYMKDNIQSLLIEPVI